MTLSNCPRCDAEPRRHGRDDGTGDYIYTLECDCDDASGVEAASPGGCERLWEERCKNVEAIMAERAYERFCEDFYGGSSPVTIEEQCQAAASLKREVG